MQGRSGTLSKVATDTIGARLRRDSENTLYIDVDGDDSTSDDLFPIVDAKGGSQTFNSSTSWSDGSVTSSWTEEAIAVEGQSDGTYRLAVKSTNTSNGNASVDWNMYSISSTGVLSDTESVWYPSASDIPITVFNQNLTTLDGQSERASVAADVMIGAGGSTAQSPNAPIKMLSNQSISASDLEKTSQDTGDATAIKSLSDLMDFEINISDPSQYGTIQSVSFKLSAADANMVYYKQDLKSGAYYNFAYDAWGPEGAKFSKSNESLSYNDVLTIYIKDNGTHDSDDRLGVIRDPGYVGSTPTKVRASADARVISAAKVNQAPTF